MGRLPLVPFGTPIDRLSAPPVVILPGAIPIRQRAGRRGGMPSRGAAVGGHA